MALNVIELPACFLHGLKRISRVFSSWINVIELPVCFPILFLAEKICLRPQGLSGAGFSNRAQ